MRVILFGASGMVGRGVLLECLDSPDVEAVLAVSRSPLDIKHPKLEVVLHKDFGDLRAIEARFRGFDACFDCMGVTSAGMKEPEYTKLTYDYAMEAARAVLAPNPEGMTFAYVSGRGTDGTEKGKVMWARVKGRTENALLAMPFRSAFMFRPGAIKPERGVKSKTAIYRAFYVVGAPLMWLMEKTAPTSITGSRAMGWAMIEAARGPPAKRVLETPDINALADAHRQRIARKEYA